MPTSVYGSSQPALSGMGLCGVAAGSRVTMVEFIRWARLSTLALGAAILSVPLLIGLFSRPPFSSPPFRYSVGVACALVGIRGIMLIYRAFKAVRSGQVQGEVARQLFWGEVLVLACFVSILTLSLVGEAR